MNEQDPMNRERRSEVFHKKVTITVALPVRERRLRYCERLVSKSPQADGHILVQKKPSPGLSVFQSPDHGEICSGTLRSIIRQSGIPNEKKLRPRR